MFRSSLIALFCLISLASASILPQVILNAQDSLSDRWHWESCGLDTDPVTIQNIEISPDPPSPGAPLSVTVTGTANELIEEGAFVDVTVKLGLIKLLQKSFNVCEEARGANASVQCPVEKGQYVVTQTVDLPKEIPPAKFKIHVEGYTKDDDSLMCLDLTIDFMKKFSW
ncbi:ML domain-containing protein [Rhodocollybia butyracea]|uniref:Phosphatidylglycerol/phosphatidylinositol transfer protein n=1 Tax=Rhodocollybia butyracea TaxID=206335 RepID=A0A9P5U8N7_9AGAR|nr:ML domain-containing protein [Rhodocollybia butyracea]